MACPTLSQVGWDGFPQSVGFISFRHAVGFNRVRKTKPQLCTGASGITLVSLKKIQHMRRF